MITQISKTFDSDKSMGKFRLFYNSKIRAYGFTCFLPIFWHKWRSEKAIFLNICALGRSKFRVRKYGNIGFLEVQSENWRWKWFNKISSNLSLILWLRIPCSEAHIVWQGHSITPVDKVNCFSRTVKHCEKSAEFDLKSIFLVRSLI